MLFTRRGQEEAEEEEKSCWVCFASESDEPSAQWTHPCRYNLHTSTLCFNDSGKLNLQNWFDFKLEPIFATAPAALKNNAHYKSS